jgi:uncharacterized membrane protein (DUF4010 family)
LRDVDVVNTFQILGISLGLGLLVGIQRERVDAPLAGVRTFALITLLGTLTGMLALRLGPWIVAAGALGVAIVTAMGNILYLKQKRPDTGITTEIAILLMYGVGVYLVFGPPQVAVVLGGGIAVLLHAKPVMHGFVKRLGEDDMRVMMQFVLITLVILPVLPDEPYGPFQVLNPRDIWRMVVLVVGISLAGYIALKLYGEGAGIILAGLIGGVISSTATTVSHARRASRAEPQIAAAILVVMLASTVVYVRVLVEIFVVAGRAFVQVAPPIVVMLIVAILLCVFLWWKNRKLEVESAAHENPTELKSAMIFGALYALVLLAVAAARHYFGDRGVYLAAAISGLTDMDAITLSASGMAARGAVSTSVAWRAIVIATISNLLFKAAVVAVLAGSPMARRIAVMFAIEIAVGLALLAMWPG